MDVNPPTARTTDAFGVVVDVEISEAFELHRVLEEKRRQGATLPLASESHVALSKPNDKPSSEHGSAFDTTLVHVRAKDRLLRSYGPRSPWISKCPNARLRSGLWVVNPELGSSNRQMGFLSHLAQLCVHSELHSCTNPSCVRAVEAMSRLAPECDWKGFREWALVAMSCQASMNDAQKRSRAHTHVARAVSGCFAILKACSDPDNHEKLLLPFLDGQDGVETRIGLTGVVNIIHWMVEIQSRVGTAAEGYGNWNHLFLPSKYALMEVQAAQRRVLESGVCQNRLWNLVNVSDRKQSELPDIIKAIEPKELFRQQEHSLCTPSKCHIAHQNNTDVPQMHRCSQDPSPCDLMRFPKDGLISRVNLGKDTSWWLNSKSRHRKVLLDTKNRPYVAISHVWSDGAGAGIRKEKGFVNSCLFGFFANIAKDVGGEAIWWDTISIPDEPEARKKSLTNMHRNYAQAKCTVVHDKYLFQFPWSDNGKPCLALVLSNWFARGWTALELAMSPKVKVLFKNPTQKKGESDYVIKDLDDDILAGSPRSSSRAHWLATALVQRIRRPIDHVGDLIAILAPRSTSWTSDRTKIATLLADVPKVDFNVDDSIITRRLLNHLGKIPYFCLLHGKPTMAEYGGFSWSAVTLNDMPVEVFGSDHTCNEEAREEDHVLTIDGSGAVWGKWVCRALDEFDILSRNIKPYGDSLPVTVKVELELGRWSRCLLLRPTEGNSDPRALLVAPIDILDDEPTVQCRYIGTVSEENPNNQRRWYKHAIQLGGDGKDQPALPGAKLLTMLREKRENPSQFRSYTRIIRHLDVDTTEDSVSIGQTLADRIPDWIRDNLTQQLSAWFNQGGVRQSWVDPGDLEPKSLIVAAEARNRKACSRSSIYFLPTTSERRRPVQAAKGTQSILQA